MVQDFAKQRTRTPLAEPEPKPSPSTQGLLLTGLLTGIAVGLFISLLVYLSGVLPPAPGQNSVLASNADRTVTPAQTITAEGSSAGADNGVSVEQEREAARLQLEFYQELPNYEVVVDASPVSASSPSSPSVAAANTTTTTPATGNADANAQQSSAPASEPTSGPAADITPTTTGMFMLQAGAFRQQTAANAQASRLLALGLDARVRQETLPGRTLFLVQAGPYNSRDEMMQAERLLRNNSIESMRITLSQP